jgi:hypothetical protein
MRAAQATVSGSVSDGVNALAGVSVEISDGRTARTTATASSPLGSYSFANVEPGTYTLSYQLPGFGTQVIIVPVKAGEALTRDVVLTRTG